MERSDVTSVVAAAPLMDSSWFDELSLKPLELACLFGRTMFNDDRERATMRYASHRMHQR